MSCRLDLGAFAPERRVEIWRASVGDAYTPLLDDAAAGRFSMVVEASRVGRLVTSRFSATAASRAHGAPETDKGAGPFLKLRIHLRGASRIACGGDEVALAPGAVHVLDEGRGRVERFGDFETLAVWVSHADAGWRPGARPAVSSLPEDAPAGRILAEAIRALHAALPAARDGGAAALADRFAAAARGVLDGGALSEAEPAMRAARRDAARRVIDARLRDPDFGVDAVLAAFGGARATLYRDFAAEGGVARYIRQRRLAAAFAELAGRREGRGAVRRAAEAWGFSSVKVFVDAFRAVYGVTPGGVIGLRVEAEAPPQSPRRPDAARIADAEVERRIATLRRLHRVMTET